MSLVLAPDKKAQEALKKAAQEEAKKAQTEAAATNEPPVAAASTDAADPDADVDIETHLGLAATAADETVPPKTSGDE